MSQNLNVRTFGFGLRAFKKFPELIPLSAIISIPCIGCVAFMGYSLATKPDVQVVKSSGVPAYEQVKGGERRKIFLMGRDRYEPIPELEQLRREIGSYKSK